MGINPLSSSLGVLGPRDGHERRPNHPVVQRVAFLQHVDHRVRLLLRWEHADGLMSVRVELFPDRVDLLEIGLLEYRAQLLQGQLDPAPQSLKGGGIRGKRRFQTVLDGKQLGGEGLDRVLVGVCELDLRPLADIVGLGFGPEPGVVVLLRLQLRLSQQLPGVGGSPRGLSADCVAGADVSTGSSPSGADWVGGSGLGIDSPQDNQLNLGYPARFQDR